MLVLTRKEQEEIVIRRGEETITVRLVKVQGRQGKLGITAPKDYVIRRAELTPDQETAGDSATHTDPT